MQFPVKSTTTSNLTSRTVPISCDIAITPSCLQALYNIPTTAAVSKLNALGISGFDGHSANSADLKEFLTLFRPDIPPDTNFTLQTLDGGSNIQIRSQAGIEANLGIQYTIGLATQVPTLFISVGSQWQDGELDGFLDIINFLLGESNPPHVLTTSYGFDENDVSRRLAS